jgi:hypothetical protein
MGRYQIEEAIKVLNQDKATTDIRKETLRVSPL